MKFACWWSRVYQLETVDERTRSAIQGRPWAKGPIWQTVDTNTSRAGRAVSLEQRWGGPSGGSTQRRGRQANR